MTNSVRHVLTSLLKTHRSAFFSVISSFVCPSVVLVRRSSFQQDEDTLIVSHILFLRNGWLLDNDVDRKPTAVIRINETV